MQSNVNVLVKEDNSVQEKIKKTALALDKKYSKKRKINEKWLMFGTGPVGKVLSIFIDVVLIAMCVVCCVFGLSSFIFKMNHLPPTFAGYSFMQVVSGSMVKAGFEIGDTIVVQKVDTKTLNVGDHIAFYKYAADYEEFNRLDTIEITQTKENTEHVYGLSFTEFFGVPSSEIAAAGKNKAQLVFHTIIEIYEDENGMYWFQTKGASNTAKDYWKVSERMVVGVYNDSPAAQTMSSLLEMLSSNTMILIIIAIPLILMSISFVFKMIKRVQITKLELDCVEEKRKITDPICVKNNIGFNLSKEDKYKVLVQAPESERETYLSLLWKDGSAPTSIRKYVIRKRFTLKENEQLLALNRACENMHANGVDGEEIARYYLTGKEDIAQEQARYKKIFKSLRKKADEHKLELEMQSAETVSVAEEAKENEMKTIEVKAEEKVENKAPAKKVAKKSATKKVEEAKPADKKVEAKAKSVKKAPAKSTAKPVDKKEASEKAPAKKTTKKAETKTADKKVASKPASKKVEKKEEPKKTTSKAKTSTKSTTKKAATK